MSRRWERTQCPAVGEGSDGQWPVLTMEGCVAFMRMGPQHRWMRKEPQVRKVTDDFTQRWQIKHPDTD